MFRADGYVGAALLRVGLSVMMLGYYVLHVPVRRLLWGANGQLDYAHYLAIARGGALALYRYSPSATYTDALLMLSIVVAAAYAIGFFPRVFCWLFFITTFANVDRNPAAGDAGQALVVLLSFLLCFMDASKYWSIHRERSHSAVISELRKSTHSAARVLLIWQVAMIYCWAAYYKLSGEEWRNGTALTYVLSLQRFQVIPAVSSWLTSHAGIVALLTWGTVLFQAAFPVVIWYRRMAPVMIALAISLHVAIAFTMGLYFFSVTMMLADLSVLSDDQFRALATSIKRWFDWRSSRVRSVERG